MLGRERSGSVSGLGEPELVCQALTTSVQRFRSIRHIRCLVMRRNKLLGTSFRDHWPSGLVRRPDSKAGPIWGGFLVYTNTMRRIGGPPEVIT